MTGDVRVIERCQHLRGCAASLPDAPRAVARRGASAPAPTDRAQSRRWRRKAACRMDLKSTCAFEGPPPARFCSTVNSRVIDAVSTRRHAVPMARFLNDQPAPSVQTGSLREADAANPNPGGLSLRKLPVCRHAPVTRLVSGAPGKAPRQSRIFRIASGATRTPSERCRFKELCHDCRGFVSLVPERYHRFQRGRASGRPVAGRQSRAG